MCSTARMCRYEIGTHLRNVECDILHRTEIVAVDVTTAVRLNADDPCENSMMAVAVKDRSTY